MSADENDSAELLRLREIEKRLVTAWHSADIELDSEMGLLRCEELRLNKRRCEKFLGYVPAKRERVAEKEG